MNENYLYPGKELQLFGNAENWKKYFSSIIKKYCTGSVLEAGAGIGGTTVLLNNNSPVKWILLEPDMQMCNILENKIISGDLPGNCIVRKGTINSLNGNEKFNTILYIDVLEHIEKDDTEMEKAANLLSNGGYLIVLSPAFQVLFSPFDRAIGHHRRYTKKKMKRITPYTLKLEQLTYLDSIGYFASLANKIFLKQKYPTQNQVMFWDKWMIPVSKLTDKLFFHSFGKSIIGVWQKKQQ
jgi:ubiquinone/menaquinone biosynthesis C-methylase UbiE